MSEFLLLAWYELAMLAVLTAVGSGVACWPRGLAPATRLALAPVLGLALSSCVLMTAGAFISMRVAAFLVLLPLALASAWFAVRQVRARGTVRLGAVDGVRIAGTAAFVGVLMNLPLAIRGSFGPIGYRVSDAVGYVGAAIGLENHRMAGAKWMEDWDLTNLFAWGYSSQVQHIGENFFPAAVNALFFWNASTTQSASMVVFLIVGALGAFAVAREVIRVRNLDVLAGVLFAGPVFFVLYINGSAATICGQAVLLPFGFFAWRVLSGGDRRDIVLLGFLAAATQTLYGSVVPAVVVAGLVVLGVGGLWAWREGRLTRALLVHATKVVGVVALLAIVFSPVSFIRNMKLWQSIAEGNDWLPMIPYDLPIQVIPAWMIGTREFYLLPYMTDDRWRDWLQGDVIPLVLIALAGLALFRNRRLLVFASLIPAVGLISLYAAQSRGCAYCVERNMVAIAPVVALLLAAIVGVLWQYRERWVKAFAVFVGFGIVVSLMHQSSVVLRRGVTASMVTPEARAVIDSTKGRKGPILLEALDVTEEAPTEMASLYHALRATTDQKLVLNAEHNGFGGMTYLPMMLGARPQQMWSAQYDWVFTHTPGIAGNREVAFRRGPYALERRTSPFDAIVVDGVLVDRAKRDDTGAAYLMPQGAPLTFWVAATRPDRVWLRFAVAGPGTDDIPIPPGVVLERRGQDRIEVCVPVPGTGDKRPVKVQFIYSAPEPGRAPGPFEVSADPKPGPVLAHTDVSTRPCPAARAEGDQ